MKSDFYFMNALLMDKCDAIPNRVAIIGRFQTEVKF